MALIPGSRQQEIDKHLHLYYSAAQKIKAEVQRLKIIVTKASGVSLSILDDVLVEDEDIYGAMKYSKAAITTSGTASLECAMLDTPEVVCYKLSTLSYAITSLMNKSPFISMVNLIANREIVPEMVQRKASINNIVENILPLLSDTEKRKTMLSGMSQVRRSIGMPGVYERAAQAILSRL